MAILLAGGTASAGLPTATRPGSRPSTIALPPEPLTEAALRDVFFIDRLRGWAVGDAGTILKTEDAGQTWERVPITAAVSLDRVFFIDQRRGWAVGGICRRLQPGGYGVVLRTEDGGATWVTVPVPQAGWLRDVVFADRDVGWACGESTAEAPVGLICTTDGGVTWQPVTGGRTAGLFGLALTVPPRGWAVGAPAPPVPPAEGSLEGVLPRPVCDPGGAPEPIPHLQLVRFSQGRVEPVPLPFAASTTLRAAVFRGTRRGWMAGDDGRLYHTTDAGATWTSGEVPWPEPARGGLDVRRLAFADDTRGWAAGDFGGVALTTTSGGQRWTAVATGGGTPLHGLYFEDATRGYAVGDLGRIIQTSNGGRSWQVLQEADTRASLVVLNVAPRGYPWTLLARYAGDQGYRSVVLDWTHETDEPERSRRAQALRRACQAVGAAASATLRAAAGDDLSRQLTRAIRTWRPAVVVVAVDPGDAGRSRQAVEAAREAFRRAGRPEAYPEHVEALGLEAWQARRLVELAPAPDAGAEGEGGALRLEKGSALVLGKEYSARLRETYSMVGLWAADQLRERPATVLHADLVRVVEEVDRRPPEVREHLFRGVHVGAGTPGRRTLAPISPAESARAERLTQAIQALWFGYLLALRQGRLSTFPAAAGEFIRANPATLEGAYALEVAGAALEALGDFSLAYVARDGLAESAADCPGLPQALYRQVMTLLGGISDPRLLQTLDPHAFNLETMMERRRHENERALRLAVLKATALKEQYPGERVLPALDFQLAAGYRAVGGRDEALALTGRYLTGGEAEEGAFLPGRERVPRERLATTWARNARGELSLAGKSPLPPPKPTLTARRTRQPPVLDGRLNEAAWQVPAEPIPLRRLVTRPDMGPGHLLLVRLLYDDETLYAGFEGRALAARGGTAPSEQEPAGDGRGYGFGDRLELLLDPRRDYATHYRFTLGLPNSASATLSGGQPVRASWRARTSLGEDRFSAELAIDLKVLQVYRASPGDAWGVNAGIARRDGTQERLSGDAPLEFTPEFGYLLFREGE